MNADTIRRFENKFVPEPNTGCFIWLGSLDVSGYGRFGLRGRNWKASRIAWLIAFGDPGELHVLHRCDNPMCVNPGHLFLGTNADNALDRAVKGRQHNSSLTPEQVREIRRLSKIGLGPASIRDALNVSADVARHVIYNRTYRHVS